MRQFLMRSLFAAGCLSAVSATSAYAQGLQSMQQRWQQQYNAQVQASQANWQQMQFQMQQQRLINQYQYQQLLNQQRYIQQQNAKPHVAMVPNTQTGSGPVLRNPLWYFNPLCNEVGAGLSPNEIVKRCPQLRR